MADALACGTPILALYQGSVPEIVRDGATGYICEVEDQRVEAVEPLNQIDRAVCRAEAEQRFSSRAMAEQYAPEYTWLVIGGNGVPSPDAARWLSRGPASNVAVP